ncbi:MAG: molybdopterin-guanine dinucleotide biosynthesis protein B [Candidatus Atribacteria bacterium]|nr:molybdopterin-guanine dinucleotide biosynthesis protein B [Candidatus Atribacteria bacterium]MBE3092600.1 molybdopterin-guanine dinucleotide biosynthesis protein B [Chloroflexota bacterium]MBE3127643.1 molybdopterin-guanine dinucleotide biosynthesis protein B [Candidatus Atribacteria bacterium]
MRVIGITGYKKSGKTTLTLKLSNELIKRGYKVAVVKHVNEDLDLVNSDTSKYKEVLTQVAAITPKEVVFFLKNKKSLEEIIKYFKADIILIEGFKREKTFPKIVCLREESEKAELFDGLQLCTAGFVSKEANEKLCDFDILKDEDIKKIANIVIEKSFKLPNLNCGECGYQDCYGLAREIVKGNKTLDDCPSLEPSTLVKVDGKIISVKPFVAKIIKNTITGLLSSLKGFIKGDIEIKIKQKYK